MASSRRQKERDAEIENLMRKRVETFHLSSTRWNDLWGDSQAVQRFGELANQAGHSLPLEFKLQRRLWEDNWQEDHTRNGMTHWLEFLVVACSEHFEFYPSNDHAPGHRLKLFEHVNPFAVSVQAIEKYVANYTPELLAEYRNGTESVCSVLPTLPQPPIQSFAIQPVHKYPPEITVPNEAIATGRSADGAEPLRLELPRSIGEFVRQMEFEGELRRFGNRPPAFGSDSVAMYNRIQSAAYAEALGFKSHPLCGRLEAFMLAEFGRFDPAGLLQLIGRVAMAMNRGAGDVRGMSVEDFVSELLLINGPLPPSDDRQTPGRNLAATLTGASKVEQIAVVAVERGKEAEPKPEDITDGQFGVDGFRFDRVEVKFGRASKQYSLIMALWDAKKKQPAEPRPVEDVISDVWGEENETSDSTFRQLCADTRRRFQIANCPLDIEYANGKVQLLRV